ncbi:hypothetical protein P4283_23500 [Bacillus thuringiensis]|nr:hypothetical protein [Bacillus thuringiensis]
MTKVDAILRLPMELKLQELKETMEQIQIKLENLENLGIPKGKASVKKCSSASVSKDIRGWKYPAQMK